MSHAVTANGFAAARRGYAPQQVDRVVSALVAQRDEAWERLGALGGLLREAEAERSAMAEAAEQAPPPEYSALSERAAGILAMAEAEAAAVRDQAAQAAERLRMEVFDEAQAMERKAATYAESIRAVADREAADILGWSRETAERLLVEAERESAMESAAAADYAAGVRARAEEGRQRAEEELMVARRAADEEEAAAEALARMEEDRVTVVAEQRMAEAGKHGETVRGRVRELEVEAQARAERMLDRAGREVLRIAELTEREQIAQAAELEKVQQQLDHIRQILATLTGMTSGRAGVSPWPGDDGSGTADIPLPPSSPPVHPVDGFNG
jgi:hypothetical protein